MIMVAMSYFCRQNMSQISLKIVANCSHPSEILAIEFDIFTIYVSQNNKKCFVLFSFFEEHSPLCVQWYAISGFDDRR